MYTSTLKAIQSLAEIRFRVITADQLRAAAARTQGPWCGWFVNNERITMKTHIIKDDGTVTVVKGKIEDLEEMQKLVKGPIEIVNAAMPAASADLPEATKLEEMVCNEEGLFNESFKTNHKARKLIAQGLGVQLDNIQDIRGDVFVTDGWRIA